MSLLSQAMAYYPFVFHPATMVGGGLLILIYVEWRREGADRGGLRRRLGALLAAGAVSLLPSLAYMVITGKGPMETMQGNVWQVDLLVAGGIFFVSGTMWLLWRRFDWGDVVPGAMEALAAVTVPYIALSPLWNVSGHVILAVTSTLYLALVDRRFWPLLAIPIVMVPNRIYVDAHTWTQSVGAFLLASVIVVGVYHFRVADGGRRTPDATLP